MDFLPEKRKKEISKQPIGHSGKRRDKDRMGWWSGQKKAWYYARATLVYNLARLSDRRNWFLSMMGCFFLGC